MKTSFVLGAVTIAGLAAGAAVAGTLDDVKARGTLNCGVSTGLTGFAAPNASGEMQARFNLFQLLGKHVLLLWLLVKLICWPVTQHGLSAAMSI